MLWFANPRDVVRADGPDAGTYLHSQLSNDVAGMAVGESRWTFLLQPAGKVDVLARVWRTGPDEYVLDTDAGFGDAMVARLQRFKIRVKADITRLEWTCIAVRGPGAAAIAGVVGWGDGVDLLGADPLPPAEATAASAAEVLDLRIAACWPAMGSEIVPGETIPAETGVVDVAVSFTKGCYPGQELVERMDSRGAQAPQHLVVLPRRDGDVPGTSVVHDGHQIGTVTSVGTTQVLAYVRRNAPAARD